MGVPFPKGELDSPAHVRLLNADGEEIPAQITPVTTWAPADSSLKWIWVFFFTGEGSEYLLEYGPETYSEFTVAKARPKGRTTFSRREMFAGLAKPLRNKA